MYRSVMILIVLMISVTSLSLHAQSDQNSDGYTADEVMAAYEAGQFRVIHIYSTSPIVSPDGAYVLAHGLYRLSDGMFFDQFNSAFEFGPDGRYLVQRGDGIYRLDDLQQVIPARSERISVGNGEHRIITGDVIFSPNGEYVACTVNLLG